VQRRLNGLGFDTKVTGKFDESTRAVIMRWQAARGYPKTGFLNTLQHKALLTEIVSAQSNSSDDNASDDRSSRRHHSGGGGGGRHYRGGGGGGGPGGFIGGVVGGLFR
jgi:peptidoglycan hydrolase-like protein with peptidoglycan-binding domain